MCLEGFPVCHGVFDSAHICTRVKEDALPRTVWNLRQMYLRLLGDSRSEKPGCRGNRNRARSHVFRPSTASCRAESRLKSSFFALSMTTRQQALLASRHAQARSLMYTSLFTVSVISGALMRCWWQGRLSLRCRYKKVYFFSYIVYMTTTGSSSGDSAKPAPSWF